MTEAIKAYLDEQAEKDAALKAKYNPELIGKCVDYINKQAEEIAKSAAGFKCGNMRGCRVEDAVVYKWARDYFIEDIAAKQEEERKKKEEQAKLDAEKKEAEKTAAKKAAKSAQSEADETADVDTVEDWAKRKLEVKPVITEKRTEKKQPAQMSLFDFGDEDA